MLEMKPPGRPSLGITYADVEKALKEHGYQTRAATALGCSPALIRKIVAKEVERLKQEMLSPLKRTQQ